MTCHRQFSGVSNVSVRGATYLKFLRVELYYPRKLNKFHTIRKEASACIHAGDPKQGSSLLNFYKPKIKMA